MLILAFMIVFAGSAMFVATKTFAESAQSEPTDLIQKIADRFGLNKDDVKAVFDQNREEHHAKMEEKFTAKLDQYVKDGKITEEQKQLIINKRKEMHSERETNMPAMQNLTAGEHRQKMEEKRTALETWAKQNNIDPSYLMGGFGRKGHMRMR
jgi:hypothetical protein